MDEKARRELIDEITQIIGGQKAEISSGVSAAIRSHIAAKSPSECLKLILRNDSGDVMRTLPMAVEKDYAKALIAFVRGQTFEGRTIDSALTDSTSEVVADVFAAKIGERADAISDKLMPLLVSDQRFIDGVADALVASFSGTVPQHLKRKVVAALSGKLTAALNQSIDTTTTASIKASVIKVTAATVSSPLGIKIAAVLVKTLAVVLKPIILKLLASSAFKAAIMSKLKAVVIGAMLGAFFKIIGVKLGLSAGAVFLWVVIPIVLAWIAYEISSFPEKLADKVSEGVVNDIDANFAQTSASMAETLVERVIVEGAAMLARSLADDDLIGEIIDESIRDAA